MGDGLPSTAHGRSTSFDQRSGQDASVTDVPYPDDHERLIDDVRTELEAQRAIRGLPLDDATLDGLADNVVTNIEYAFDVNWAPRWIKDGSYHRWIDTPPDAAPSHFVECLRCARITVIHLRTTPTSGAKRISALITTELFARRTPGELGHGRSGVLRRA